LKTEHSILPDRLQSDFLSEFKRINPMLISVCDVAPAYKALEKEETRAMEGVLKSAIDAAPTETFATTILTRPANPMRSSASWFLTRALINGPGISEDGVAIRTTIDGAETLSSIANVIWHSIDEESLLLLVASDGSVVVGRDDPEAKEILFLPLALQLRGTLKDKARTSIKQIYRTGDGQSKHEGVFLSVKDGDVLNMLNEVDAFHQRSEVWLQQIEVEIRALFDYQVARPLQNPKSSGYQSTFVPMGMNMRVKFEPSEMAFLCRNNIQDSDRHLGFRSFSPADQNILEKALDLALAGWLPEGTADTFYGYEVTLIAGSPYNGSSAHLKVDANSIASRAGPHSRKELETLLPPVIDALTPLLEKMHPEAMVHNQDDIKASWTIARLAPRVVSDHARLAARRDFESLMKENLNNRA
jgi:hypothetical protein